MKNGTDPGRRPGRRGTQRAPNIGECERTLVLLLLLLLGPPLAAALLVAAIHRDWDIATITAMMVWTASTLWTCVYFVYQHDEPGGAELHKALHGDNRRERVASAALLAVRPTIYGTLGAGLLIGVTLWLVGGGAAQGVVMTQWGPLFCGTWLTTVAVTQLRHAKKSP